MSAEIGSMLDSYISQLEAMLTKLEYLRRRSKGQTTRAEDRLYGEIAGAIGQEVFESPRGGKLFKGLTTYLVETNRRALLKEQQIIASQFHQLLEYMDSYLSTLSILTSRLKPSGNSQQLRRRMARCYGAARVETRISRAIQALHSMRSEKLVRNVDIQKELDKMYADEQGTEAYEMLRRLETGLREFIAVRLGALNPDWWNKRIPDDVRDRAEERKEKDSRLWPWQNETSEPIQYVDFTDYVKIIARRDNWDEVFAQVFKDKEITSGKLRELDPIRKDIAHSRKLSPLKLKRLQVYAQDILGAIREG